MIKDDPKFRNLLYVLKIPVLYLTACVHVYMAEDVLQSCRDLKERAWRTVPTLVILCTDVTGWPSKRRLLPNESRHALHASRDVELGYENMFLKTEMKYSRWPKCIHLYFFAAYLQEQWESKVVMRRVSLNKLDSPDR